MRQLRSSALLWIAALGLMVLPALVPATAVAIPVDCLPCNPIEQWRWDASERSPGSMACSTPLVVQLTDDNGDGRIDERDVPDVLFAPNFYHGGLTALSGDTGATLFSLDTPLLKTLTLAAGDIDGDGMVEIVSGASRRELSIVALEHDGTLKWSNPDLYVGHLDPIGIADLDQDGTPEIYWFDTIANADGSFRCRAQVFAGPGMHVTQAVDLLPDRPGLELILGGTVFDADCRTIWSDPAIGDAWTAVGNLDSDAHPELVAAQKMLGTGGDLFVFDLPGGELLSFPLGDGATSRPVLADLDGDGRAEIFIAAGLTAYSLAVVNGNLTVQWSRPVYDPTCCSGASAFDFEGDGAWEIIYSDHTGWYILDGRTGASLVERTHDSVTLLEYPVVADIDGDGLPEILTAGCNPLSAAPSDLVAWECAGSAPARGIWNQYGYHISNVNDDGTIPRVEPPSHETHNTWLAQERTGRCEDLPPVCDAGGPYEVTCETAPPCSLLPDGREVLLDGSASYDPEGGRLDYQWYISCGGLAFGGPNRATATQCMPVHCLQPCYASLSVTDPLGQTDHCMAEVTLTDDTAPALTPPADDTIECDEPQDPSNTGSATALDNCDGPLPTTWSDTILPGNCPGNYTILRTWSAIDSCGNLSSDTQTITVRDTTPPVVTESFEDIHCLWPPNHKHVPFTRADFNPRITDNCSEPIVWVFEGCASDQPDDGLGDGSTGEDCVVAPDGTGFLVRSERSGLLPAGRRYRTTIMATDACGNSAAPADIGGIHVPHDQDPPCAKRRAP